MRVAIKDKQVLPRTKFEQDSVLPQTQSVRVLESFQFHYVELPREPLVPQRVQTTQNPVSQVQVQHIDLLQRVLLEMEMVALQTAISSSVLLPRLAPTPGYPSLWRERTRR